MGDFIPHTDHGALDWMQRFSQGITAAPASYMLTAADATAISNAVNAYATAYAANDPATKNKVTVITKNNTRAAAEALCRQYASLIKPNAGITDEDKTAIGVPPINKERTPVPVPQTSPMLGIYDATPGAHTLRFSDSTTPDSPAKPYGAVQLQVFVAVGDGPATSPETATYQGSHTRNAVRVTFPPGQDGKMATYFARWVGIRGDVGPWSLPVSMRIAA